MKEDFKILISRTDSIGDVILTLPMLGIIKKHYPKCTLYFLGSNYTRPIAARCKHIDYFVSVDDLSLESLTALELDICIHVFPKKHISLLAKKAGIPLRIGTSHRLYHWSTCNKLVSFTRVNSCSHEAILNLNLLTPLNIKNNYELNELSHYSGWIPKKIKNEMFDNNKVNILFHMKSNGSSVEWPVTNYFLLSNLLPSNKYSIYLTGTEEEKIKIEKECSNIFELSHVRDMMGKFNLNEFIDFVSGSDGLVACSTGALHIASTFGINTVGLYPNKKPMHSGRWSPIGPNSTVFDVDVNQNKNISVLDLNHEEVLKVLKQWETN